MAELDSNVSLDEEKDTDNGHMALIRVTDCQDVTARVQLVQRLSWPAVVRLLRALSPDDAMLS